MDEYHEAERVKNIRAGTVAAMCMNAQRSSKDQKVWGWGDFFGDAKPEPRAKNRHEKLLMLQRFKAAAGQRKIRR